MVCGDFSSIPLTRRCADAFEALGCRVGRFDSEDRMRRGTGIAMRVAKSLAKPFGLKHRVAGAFAVTIYRRRRERLLAAAAAFAPDALLVVRGNHFDVETLAGLRRRARTACWFVRDQKRQAAMRAERGAYDLYYSMHRCHEAEGIPWLPAFAWEPDDYHPDAAVAKDVPLLFLGGWTARRQQWLESLGDLAPRLSLIGPHWRVRLGAAHPLQAAVKADWVQGEAVRRWYQRAQVVININQWDAGELSGANLRVADVPACGTVLLSEASPDLGDLFVAGEELAVFHDRAELRAQCAALLGDAALRRRIEAAGLAAVARLGTYRERMARVLHDLERLPPPAAR